MITYITNTFIDNILLIKLYFSSPSPAGASTIVVIYHNNMWFKHLDFC